MSSSQDENRFTREVHFKNEAFYIGILHAVAGGSLVAGLHELDGLLTLAAPALVLWFLTLMASALGAAVIAAGLKHGYKMYDMKAQAAATEGDGRSHLGRANRRLSWMRRMMTTSTALLLLGYALLLAGGWYRFLTDPEMFDELNSPKAATFRSVLRN